MPGVRTGNQSTTMKVVEAKMKRCLSAVVANRLAAATAPELPPGRWRIPVKLIALPGGWFYMVGPYCRSRAD